MYISNDVAERIKQCAKQKGITANQLLLTVGLGKSTLSNFKTSMPKADTLAKIADYLGCSVDFLLGRTDEKTPADQMVSELTKERQALINLIMACPEERAKDLLTAMQLFLQNWQR